MAKWNTISEDGNSVVLAHFVGLQSAKLNQFDADRHKIACVVDVETTGLHPSAEIIEIGLRIFSFEPVSGKILEIGDSYNQFQSPTKPLPEKISAITGIKASDLKGQKIDWAIVKKFFDSSHIIVAHNASFDRMFVDRHVQYSGRQVWACSQKQVDWASYGYPTQSLPMLAAHHGFFANSHRAQVDVDLLVKLLSLNEKYIKDLYANAHEPRVTLKVLNSDFDRKHFLKERNYFWNPTGKNWWITILKSNLAEEINFLPSVCNNREPVYEIDEIPLSENFKSPFRPS